MSLDGFRFFTCSWCFIPWWAKMDLGSDCNSGNLAISFFDTFVKSNSSPFSAFLRPFFCCCFLAFFMAPVYFYSFYFLQTSFNCIFLKLPFRNKKLVWVTPSIWSTTFSRGWRSPYFRSPPFSKGKRRWRHPLSLGKHFCSKRYWVDWLAYQLTRLVFL